MLLQRRLTFQQNRVSLKTSPLTQRAVAVHTAPMTSPKNPLFAWQGRDHAARSMYALSLHAPPLLRGRALRLLSSFKSAVLVDEMVALVMDDSRDVWERRAGLWALAAVPTGELYLPEFAQFFEPTYPSYDMVSPEDFIGFIARHPRNRGWAFDAMASKPPEVYLEWLLYGRNIAVDGVDTYPFFYPYLVEFERQHPGSIPSDDLTPPDEDEPADERGPELTYPEGFVKGELWALYELALAGDEDAFSTLNDAANYSYDDPNRRAAAIHLIGKLKDRYPAAVDKLMLTLRYASDPPALPGGFDGINYLRYEAGEALRDHPTSAAWEAMIDTYLTYIDNLLSAFLEEWIQDLTDQLSGVPVPRYGYRWGLKRYWLTGLSGQV